MDRVSPHLSEFKMAKITLIFTAHRLHSQSIVVPQLFDAMSDFRERINTLSRESSQRANKRSQTALTQCTKPRRLYKNQLWYLLMLLSFTSIPLLNLFLIYSQEYSKNKETKLGASKSGRDDDGAGNFTNYYITIGVYLLVTVNFVVFSFQFQDRWEAIREYFLVDTLLIAEIVSAIAYIGLHIAYFCADYYTRTVLVTWQDYAVMGLYVCSNFAMLGAFRVTMIRVKWSAAQIIIIKLFVIMSSMAYILVGVIFLFGYDSCSSAFSDFKDSQFNQTVLLSPVRDRERIFDNLKHTTAMALLLNTIQNFVLLYVFANFAFIFELFKKTTDFDGTNFFRTDYKLVDEPRHTQKKT